MNKKLLAIILSILILAACGCGSKPALPPQTSSPAPGSDSASYPPVDKTSSAETTAVNTTAAGSSLPSLDSVSKDQKIIKNAELSITVQNNNETEKKVQELVVKYQGMVQNTDTYSNKEQSSTDMIVRVPADRFDAFLGELKLLGEITQSKVYTTDVTEEYIDLGAREKTYKLQEERLQEMLKKTANVDEMLKVENELARVRGEIERIQGRLKYLDNKTSYSTVTIYLTTKYISTESETKNIGSDLLFNLKEGFSTFINFILGLLEVIAYFLPFIVIGVPLFIYFRKKIIIRRQNKMK